MIAFLNRQISLHTLNRRTLNMIRPITLAFITTYLFFPCPTPGNPNNHLSPFKWGTLMDTIWLRQIQVAGRVSFILMTFTWVDCCNRPLCSLVCWLNNNCTCFNASKYKFVFQVNHTYTTEWCQRGYKCRTRIKYILT